MSTVLLSACERAYDPRRTYDETLNRMYAEIDICKKPDYVGDYPKWFQGASLSDIDLVSSQITFERNRDALYMDIDDGSFVSMTACVAVMKELLSQTDEDQLHDFEIMIVWQSPVATKAATFSLSIRPKGFLIKSVLKN